MKYLKTFEIFQDFESEDFVIALPSFPTEGGWHTKKNFVTTNVGEVMSSTKEMIKIRYVINPNSPENGYITDINNEISSYKKYFRFATTEEIDLQNSKNDASKYNI